MAEETLQDLEGLKKEITDAAAAEVNAAIEGAEQKAREILEKARREGEKRQKEILGRAQARAEESRRRLLTAAELERRKQILAYKQALLERAFAGAEQALAQLPLPEYQAAARRLLVAGARTGCEEVLVAPEEAERLTLEILAAAQAELVAAGQEVELRRVLSEDPRLKRGGFILRGENMEVDCTFPVLVATVREGLESEVARVLFSES